MLNLWVKRGWAVVKTDYEGLGTPGPHPYLAGASAARGTIDIVTAARHLHPGIGRRWAVMGHYQGGHAALFTASLAPARAPGSRPDRRRSHRPRQRHSRHNRRAPELPRACPRAGIPRPDANRRRRHRPRPAARPTAHPPRPPPAGHRPDRRHRRPSRPRPVAAIWCLQTCSGPAPTSGPLLAVLAANDPAALRLRAPALIVQGSNDPITDPRAHRPHHALPQRQRRSARLPHVSRHGSLRRDRGSAYPERAVDRRPAGRHAGRPPASPVDEK